MVTPEAEATKETPVVKTEENVGRWQQFKEGVVNHSSYLSSRKERKAVAEKMAKDLVVLAGDLEKVDKNDPEAVGQLAEAMKRLTAITAESISLISAGQETAEKPSKYYRDDLVRLILQTQNEKKEETDQENNEGENKDEKIVAQEEELGGFSPRKNNVYRVIGRSKLLKTEPWVVATVAKIPVVNRVLAKDYKEASQQRLDQLRTYSLVKELFEAAGLSRSYSENELRNLIERYAKWGMKKDKTNPSGHSLKETLSKDERKDFKKIANLVAGYLDLKVHPDFAMDDKLKQSMREILKDSFKKPDRKKLKAYFKNNSILAAAFTTGAKVETPDLVEDDEEGEPTTAPAPGVASPAPDVPGDAATNVEPKVEAPQLTELKNKFKDFHQNYNNGVYEDKINYYLFGRDLKDFNLLLLKGKLFIDKYLAGDFGNDIEKLTDDQILAIIYFSKNYNQLSEDLKSTITEEDLSNMVESLLN